MLNKLLLSACFFLAFTACEKNETTADPALADLTIGKTTTPSNQTQQNGIVSQIKATGPNLCYQFSKFDVKETGTREFEIRAKAANAGDKPGVFCAQAIYTVDTTLKVNAATKGKYLLRFYNQQQLFKTDTVEIN